MAKAKEIEGLDCGAAAARGMRLVLLTRLAEMCEHREAALDTRSDEGIHDMRVASRRLRSVLRDFRVQLRDSKQLDRARADLKRLARALGAVRDEDVAVGALEKLATQAPEEAREGLRLFIDERRERRESALAALKPELDADSFEQWRNRVALAFEKATERTKKMDGDDVEDSFNDLGRVVILRSCEELCGRGNDIFRPLKAKRLHKIRIASKRLRYLLELFAACFGEGAKELARELAGLQKTLGNLHDCDEWIIECGERLKKSDVAAACAGRVEKSAQRAAAFWLLEYSLAERDANYAEALSIWRGWEREGFGARLDEIVAGRL